MWIPGFDGPDVGLTVPVGDLDEWTAGRTITKDRVFEGVRFSSVVTVKADVTFRDCYFRPSPSYGLNVSTGSATLRDCTVDGFARTPAGAANGVAGNNIDAARVLICGFEDGIKGCSDSTFTMCQVVAHASQSSSPHADSVQLTKGGNLTLRHCNLDCHWDAAGHGNAAVFLKTDKGDIDNVMVDSCWLGGGNYTVFSRIGYEPGTVAPTDVTVRRCIFGPDVAYGRFSTDGPITRRCNVDHEGNPL